LIRAGNMETYPSRYASYQNNDPIQKFSEILDQLSNITKEDIEGLTEMACQCYGHYEQIA